MKKIIVCCDGTWNKPGNKDRGKIVKTNVQKIYEAVISDSIAARQVKYYGQGVGTGYSFKDYFLGGSTGLGIDRNILDAYKFIMWNFESGDEIYLFGFSRGAYTVRSLAGFIRNCGILKPAYLNLADEAYGLYRDRTAITHPDSDLMMAFKRKYGIDDQDTGIKFLGVWDTVGALGIPLKWFDFLNKKYQFHDVKISSQISYAYHALATDEKRKTFSPALWELSSKTTSAPDLQTSEQVWFSGVHSNIGGGYADNGLSDITLKWMMEKAEKTGLLFNDDYSQTIHPDYQGELRNSCIGIFRLLKKSRRIINSGIAVRKDEETGIRKTESVLRNEHIHYTLLERMTDLTRYHPANVTTEVLRKTPYEPPERTFKSFITPRFVIGESNI